MLEGFEPLAPLNADNKRMTITFIHLKRGNSWRASFNGGATERGKLGRDIEVLHNPEAKEVAFRPTTPSNPSRFKATPTGGSLAISGGQVATLIGVTPDRRKFPLELRDGALILSYT